MWTWSYTASYVHYTMINICFLPKPYAANEFWHKCCQGFSFRKFKLCRSKFRTNHLFFKSVSMQHKTRQLVCVSDGAKALSNLYGKYRYDLVVKYLNLLLKANSEKLLDTLFQVIPHDPCPWSVTLTLKNLGILVILLPAPQYCSCQDSCLLILNQDFGSLILNDLYQNCNISFRIQLFENAVGFFFFVWKQQTFFFK